MGLGEYLHVPLSRYTYINGQTLGYKEVSTLWPMDTDSKAQTGGATDEASARDDGG